MLCLIFILNRLIESEITQFILGRLGERICVKCDTLIGRFLFISRCKQFSENS